jgi:putative protease
MAEYQSIGRPAPELLAPAGNWECIHAAIENGADAVYFGLDVGFNARARAANFHVDELPLVMETLHRRGLVGYVTLNTLVFTDELPHLERHVAMIAQAGVDAVLVQDIGVVRLIREICPELSVHASTQMTMVSAESIAAIEDLGISRVVLARELSIREIRKITSATKMPVETFVHGALCVAYSGQCLTSESLGGRSANRGQCAQACRLHYDLLCDGKPVDLGDNRYLLSPQDLAGYAHIPDLIDAGVCSLKIEGRLKTPEYVANIVGHYRRAIDEAIAGRDVKWSPESQREMELSFSRGFSPGWLEGCNHKRLVPGLSSAKKGVKAGSVLRMRGQNVIVHLDVPLMAGDGIVFDGDRISGKELGGRIFQIFADGKLADGPVEGRAELSFQRGLLQDANLAEGIALWQTDSPQLTKRLRASFDTKHPRRKQKIGLSIDVAVGKASRIEAWLEKSPVHRIVLEHPFAPEEARKHPTTPENIREQLGRLGTTPFEIGDFHARLTGTPMLPLSVLGEMRKELVQCLERELIATPPRTIASPGVAALMIERIEQEQQNCPRESETIELRALVRSLQQLDAVLEEGQKFVYADFHDIREYEQAVVRARSAEATIYLATLRIQKPGEYPLFRALEKRNADGWLVRNLAALQFARNHRIPAVCDFSLNVTNPLTAQWLRTQGASRITASYDLNREQLHELITAVPSDWAEVVIHQHMPMFHMEHCVFCTVLSPGTNKTNCGRPCDRHDVKLRDRIGAEHVLHADVGCRNTLFNGQAQSGAEAVPTLIRLGIRHFRIEMLRDAPKKDVAELLDLYRRLLAGSLDGAEVWKRLKATNRVGVTRGTLEQPRNPLAIL